MNQTTDDVPTEGRNTRRRERTRSALVRAAHELLASGAAQDASVKTITDLADVGFGSFFNHFTSKTELFETAIAEAAQRYEQWLDIRLATVTDPLRRLALSIRFTGRLHASHPQDAALLIGQLPFLHAGNRPLSIRVIADVTAAMAAVSPDARAGSRPDVTVISAMGAIGAVLQEVGNLRDDEVAVMADALVSDVLRVLGANDDVILALVNEPLDSIS